MTPEAIGILIEKYLTRTLSQADCVEDELRYLVGSGMLSKGEDGLYEITTKGKAQVDRFVSTLKQAYKGPSSE